MLKKDWKKNLLRVKQMADQNLGRAEKSEVLSEDLQEIEKRVDQVKQAFKQTHTKLAACMQGQGLDPEKRRRKMPETLLASTLMDSAGLMSSDSLLAKMFGFCGSATGRVAEAHLKYEVDVENNILNQLHHILEQDIPAIMKLRKQLTKVTLDMDSARTRYQSANKQTHTGNSGASKVETIREEMEDAEMRVEQLKDQIATDMYQFMAQDKVYSQILVDFVQYQAEYHRQALAELEQVLPAMLEETNCTEQMPVFGQALEDHLMRTRRDISSVIEDCVITLKHIGMDEEGLFRVTGSSSKIKRLKSSFDAGMNDMEEYIHDIHCVAAALKLYLRELPEPLMTFRLYDDWMHAAHLPMDQRLQAYWLVLDKMPKANYNNLRYLIKFLAKLAENQELNKMSASNIAIVMGPNLLWPHGEGGPSVLTTGTQSAIVESLVTHADWFFPGDLDFHKTGQGMSSPAPEGKRFNAPPPPANHLMTRPRPKSVHAMNLNATTSSTVSASAGSMREGSPNPKTHSASPRMTTASIQGPMTLSRQNSLSNSSSKIMDIKDGAKTAKTSSQTAHSDSHLDTSRESLRKDLSQRYSWNDRPLRMESSSGVLATPLSTTSSSCTSPLAQDTMNSAKVNGDLGSRMSVEGDAISDTMSEPGTLNRSSLRRIKSSRSTTPPPKPPLPNAKSVHNDVYNTVFALQSLGDGAWSDYLTRVRTLMEGSMSKSYSIPSGDLGSGRGSGNHAEIDFHMTSSSSSSPVLIPTNNGASDHDQELASGASSSSSEPVAMGTLTHSTSASTSARAPSPGPMISSPQNSLNSMSTSTGSLTEAGSERLSPKVQRRVTRKPPAPLPPMPPERHPSQEKTFPESVAVAEPSTPSFTISPPEEKLADRNSLERPVVPNRPPIPPEKPTSPRHDRPKVPPPDRPHGPPPDKPEKPPMYRHERSSSNPPLPTITPAPQRCTSNPGANKPERPEKPGLPPPPASFQRQGSGRPPRPQPPPPHPPDRRTSQESVNKAPLAQQEPASDKTDHLAENLDTKL